MIIMSDINRDIIDAQFNNSRCLFEDDKINDMKRAYAEMEKYEVIIRKICSKDIQKTYDNLGWLLSNVCTIKKAYKRFIELKRLNIPSDSERNELDEIYSYLNKVINKTLELQTKNR